MGEKSCRVDATFEDWLNREINSADRAMKMRADEKCYGLAEMWHNRKETLCNVRDAFEQFRPCPEVEHPGQIEGDDGPFCYNHPKGCEKPRKGRAENVEARE